MIKIKDTFEMSNKEMRKIYAATMIDLAKENEKVCVLEADLSGAIATAPVKDAIKERFINCGIMEANMAGVAAGLSLRGFVPYAHTFTAFASRRMFDQLFLSVAYADLNVKIIASDSGVSAQHNGGTHMSFEDVGMLRLIPNATVMDMSDPVMLEDILRQTSKRYGLDYIRLVRKNMYSLYEEGSTFEIGKGIVLTEGTDVLLIATGIMVHEAIKAQEELAKDGISATVIDMFTIKPIDRELIVKHSQNKKVVVTCENSSVIGGLGDAVSEVLSVTNPLIHERIGINRKFGQVGTLDFLKEEYGLTSSEIVKRVKKHI